MTPAVALLVLSNIGWADTRRFALIAGANDGGADRIQLQYAITDAAAIGNVLAELGGIPRANQTVLIEPNADVLREAINNLSNTVAQAEAVGMRTEVIFYYSGHSNESGLLLGESHFLYPDLKRSLEAIPSDVKVVILDSCASGAMVRSKGGVARPAFLEDRTNDVQGTAYVMSSAANEASQESDVVGASYFTHFLVSGMRGAADRSLDGRVTLHEAWDFAARETLQRTERTSIGAQHPFFHRDLGGHGDFVFTDLTQTSSSLVFDERIEGRLFVRDGDGDLVAELAKPHGDSVELALSAGLYTVVLQQGSERYEAVFDIGDAEHMMVDDLEFTPIETETVRARGDRPKVVLPTPPVVPDQPVPPPPLPRSKNAPPPSRVMQLEIIPRAHSVNYQLGLIGTNAEHVKGAQTGSLFTSADHLMGLQASLIVNIARSASTGVQAAWLVNIASEQITGLQASFFNGAHELKGAQVGLVNHAKKSVGLQVGLINSGGDGKGLQVGLVNVAKDYDGAALGLLNFHKAGYSHFFVNGGGPETLLLSGSFGSRYLYTSLQMGTSMGHGLAASIGGGFGVHVPAQRFYVDVDTIIGWRVGRRHGSQSGSSSSGQPLFRSRLQAGYTIAKHFSIQTGPMVEWYPNGTWSNVELGEDLLTGWTVGMRF